MKRILIGHRGVGKSSLLERHQQYFPEVPAYDVDQVIYEKEDKTISEIFISEGENFFRELEKKYFNELVQQKNYVISVGAGFNPTLLPQDAEVIYVSRRTDSDGRLFLNRPRLNPEVSAIQESILRYQQREPLFRKSASWVYHLSEGICDIDDIEEQIFKKDFLVEHAYFTLTSESEINQWPNLTKFELRTDGFSIDEIKQITPKYRDKRFLVAVRSNVLPEQLKGLKVDWALEYGSIPQGVEAPLVSMHDGEFFHSLTVITALAQGRHLKFCPIVNTWDELIAGYRWQQEDPQNRSFLPRTDFSSHQKSRWRWFRNLMWQKQKINFVQGRTDFDDQPSFYEYINAVTIGQKQFGAVIGDPIHHSRTPALQGPNMRDYGQILAIPLAEDDFRKAIPFLTELGLKFVAVTSPLKFKAAELLGFGDKQLGINTLFYKKDHWVGTSSDADGFSTMLEESEIENIQSRPVAIWGGGGVVGAIKDVLPQAVEFSARTGTRKDGEINLNFKPEVVIWAAPRASTVVMPPHEWQPQFIVDLNYVENSLGLEYAQSQTQAQYISGLDMLYAQAKNQFKFWAEHFLTERR